MDRDAHQHDGGGAHTGGGKMRRVLVLSWSQSGQLHQVAHAFAQPFADAGHEVVYRELKPLEPFPFPWKVTTFFGAFPETVLERPGAIAPVDAPGEWDLVVLAAQVWFLSPSPPFIAYLTGPDAALLSGRRVVTLVACRNMWVRGWRRLVALAQARGALVTDRVVATHSGSVLASYFSTLFWMLTGRRDVVKALPAAGIDAATFARVARLGAHAAARIDTPGPLLDDQDCATISPTHAFGEVIVGAIFPWLAHAIAAMSRPGSGMRALCAYGMLGFILGALFTLLLPCTLIRFACRPWIDPWLEARARLPVVR